MGRRYVRDKRGRFAPKGYSGQTSGHGARLTGKGDTGKGARMKAAAPAGVMSKSSKPKLKPSSSGPKSVIKPGPGTASLSAKRAGATKNAVRPGPKLGPSNAKNKVVKGPDRPKKSMKEKLQDLKSETKNILDRMNEKDKKRAQKAFDKPSVTDKRSRDYLGRLTKEGKGQDPSTGGKKKRKRKPKK